MFLFFLKTSADCGEIEDVIQAYHRLIDLKTKYIDKEVGRFSLNSIVMGILGITTISSFISRG